MSEDHDDVDGVQEAFQAFMLSNGSGGSSSKVKKKKKKRRQSNANSSVDDPRTPPPQSPLLRTPQKTPSSSTPSSPSTPAAREIRNYWQIIKAFRGILQRDWLGCDDHLGRVMSSIQDLQRRIRLEHHYQQRQQKPETKNQNCYLTLDDIGLALSHDLQQHETMLGGARRLVSELNDAQEALGRRLEELMVYDHEFRQTTTFLEQPTRNGSDVWDYVSCLEDLYCMLALELYRKQQLVQTVLDSTTDRILQQDNYQLNSTDTKATAVDACVATWSRKTSKESCVDPQLLEKILNLGN